MTLKPHVHFASVGQAQLLISAICSGRLQEPIFYSNLHSNMFVLEAQWGPVHEALLGAGPRCPNSRTSAPKHLKNEIGTPETAKYMAP
jgi:hypothetical protein